jgi:hypothetical protein
MISFWISVVPPKIDWRRLSAQGGPLGPNASSSQPGVWCCYAATVGSRRRDLRPCWSGGATRNMDECGVMEVAGDGGSCCFV